MQARRTRRRPFDPMRYCVYTTIALLAWIVSAPVMMMAMSALGLVAYVRAMRDGLTRSKCVLRKPRLGALLSEYCFRRGSGGDRHAHHALTPLRHGVLSAAESPVRGVGHTEVDRRIGRESSPAPGRRLVTGKVNVVLPVTVYVCVPRAIGVGACSVPPTGVIAIEPRST